MRRAKLDQRGEHEVGETFILNVLDPASAVRVEGGIRAAEAKEALELREAELEVVRRGAEPCSGRI